MFEFLKFKQKPIYGYLWAINIIFIYLFNLLTPDGNLHDDSTKYDIGKSLHTWQQILDVLCKLNYTRTQTSDNRCI